MKIFVDENIPLGPEAFQEFGQTVPFAGRALTQADLRDADALIIRSITKISDELLENTQVKFVGTATIGTDHVDQAYLKQRGIGFSSAPGCNSNSVGEYVCTSLLRLQKEYGFALSGKVIGIVGYGHVGKNLAKKAEALGLKVLLCDPPLEAEELAHGGAKTAFFSLDFLSQKCDIISLHVPLTKSGPYTTHRILNQKFFQTLTRPLVLINTCRGEVIVEADLIEAKKAGKLKHLVLDVFSGEPNIDPQLASLAEIITPHIAGYSYLGKLNGTTQIAQAFCSFFGLSSAWKAKYPPPVNPEIHFPSGTATISEEDFLYQCLTTAYPQFQDEKNLRQSLTGQNPGKEFDQLRKSYPIRHEFTQYSIHGLSDEKRNLRSQLLKLGFRVR